MRSTTRPLRLVRQMLAAVMLLCCSSPLWGGDPHSAYYSAATDNLLWFVHASDSHLGTLGSTDSTNLGWLVGEARSIIAPSFIVVSGDLTDSTNGNIFGYPNGPYQAEWDQYKSILDQKVDAGFYFDIPGNHDAYNDQFFSYYLANSIQGRATGKTQHSWTRCGPWGTHHFIGVNSAGNNGASFSFFWPYGDYAGLDSSEIDFIAEAMLDNPDAELTLIFGHHPLVPTGDSSDTYLLYGKNEFVTLMNGNESSLYGYGHTHASSEKFFIENMNDGILYFNVSSLGKDSPNQYTVTAIDCNAISSVTQSVGTWPVVLITAPMDRRLGGGVNPYAYSVTNGTTNPVRALVFDPTTVSLVQFRVNSGSWQPMTTVPGNSRLWQGTWDASLLAEGEYTLEVQASSGSGLRSDSIATYVTSQVLPRVGVTDMRTGKYVTSGTKKNKVTLFTETTSFTQGDTVIIRSTVKDAAGVPLANATVQLALSGPSSATLTSAPSDASGMAEASWTTTAPNKRGVGGTPTGEYTARVSGVTAAGYQWDNNATTVQFTLAPK